MCWSGAVTLRVVYRYPNSSLSALLKLTRLALQDSSNTVHGQDGCGPSGLDVVGYLDMLGADVPLEYFSLELLSSTFP